MLQKKSPVTVALKESLNEITTLREFLCREGFWSDREAKKIIAETRDDLTRAVP
jgi:hypothetical protein